MNQNSTHILVVDDHSEIRDLLKRFLEQHGLRVSCARDGKEMKRLLEEREFDLLVLDLMMPGEEGLTLCRELRAKSSLPIAAQTQSVLDQIDTVLAQAGSDKAHILSATIYLSSMGDFAAMNAVWDAWIGTTGIGPARATVEARLARPDIKVEIMVTAAVK